MVFRDVFLAFFGPIFPVFVEARWSQECRARVRSQFRCHLKEWNEVTEVNQSLNCRHRRCKILQAFLNEINLLANFPKLRRVIEV